MAHSIGLATANAKHFVIVYNMTPYSQFDTKMSVDEINRKQIAPSGQWYPSFKKLLKIVGLKYVFEYFFIF